MAGYGISTCGIPTVLNLVNVTIGSELHCECYSLLIEVHGIHYSFSIVLANGLTDTNCPKHI